MLLYDIYISAGDLYNVSVTVQPPMAEGSRYVSFMG